MNYRHAFHAGNHADVLKHIALLFCLDALRRKDAPFAVLDTHAGPGLYDLTGEEAVRSPEWRGGAGRLWDWRDGAPEPIARYRDALSSSNPTGQLISYPGSPALIAQALRAQDRLAACELHPESAAALKARFARFPNVQTHARDGWEALGGLLPPPERRGLVLIDPPYEAPDELERSAQALIHALRRFGHGVFLWWRPLKNASALDRVDGDVRAHVAKTLRADLWVAPPAREGKLAGSSIFLINPPYGLAKVLGAVLPALSERLAVSPGAGWRLDDAEAGPDQSA